MSHVGNAEDGSFSAHAGGESACPPPIVVFKLVFKLVELCVHVSGSVCKEMAAWAQRDGCLDAAARCLRQSDRATTLSACLRLGFSFQGSGTETLNLKVSDLEVRDLKVNQRIPEP